LRTVAPVAGALPTGPATPVRDFLKPEQGRINVPADVTLGDLAQHYAGLPVNLTNWSQIPNLDVFFADVSECYTGDAGCQASFFPPPAPLPVHGKHSYSDLGFDLLGHFIGLNDGFRARAASAWEQDLSRNVLFPLHLKAAASEEAEQGPNRAAAFANRKATGTAFADGSYSAIPNEALPSIPYGDPGGGLWSNASDVMRWLRFSSGMLHAPTSSLSYALRESWQDPKVWRPADPGNNIGYAWNVASGHSTPANSIDSTTTVAKGGSTVGFESYATFAAHGTRAAFMLMNVGTSADAAHGFVPTPAGCALMRKLPPAKHKLACASGL
jgi:CubicO group peptidase (beta-lactamase class C family)